MELVQAVRQRRSTAPVGEDAPTDDQLRNYLSIAAHSPDHAGLRPWRLVTLRGEQRRRLGQAMAIGFGDQTGTPEAERTASKTLRAPLLLGIVGVLSEHPKVPEWEQIAATAALITTLQLVLFDDGWTAMWRSGPAVDLVQVHRVMGLQPGEKLLGWLYVGSRDPRTQPSARDLVDPDVRSKLTTLPE